MAEICAPDCTPLLIPDNLSVPQFILDSQHPARPLRKEGMPWLIDDESGRGIGLEELRSRTFGLANALRMMWNIGENDVVCIFSPNHVDYPVAVWAVHRLGAIVSPANPAYTLDELVHQLTLTKARLILAHPDFSVTALSAARVSGIPADHVAFFNSDTDSVLPPGQMAVNDLITAGLNHKLAFVEKQFQDGEAKTKLAFLSFSSGTTGKPKAVAIPHCSVIANVIQLAVHQKANVTYTNWTEARFRPGDRVTAVLPFFHIYGLIVNIHFMLFCALSVVVIPKFQFVTFLQSIVRHRITHLLLVPPHIVLFCKHPAVKQYDLSHIRVCMSGAAPLSAELMDQFAKVLPNCSFGQGYGLTESSTALTMIPVSQRIGTAGSAGQLVPGVRARVVKQDGSLARIGEEGELFVNSPSLALGYFNDPRSTKETFIDGWLRTGDEVFINENAEVFIVDRLKELIKVRGFQVAPAELEGHLLSHWAVADVCVVGVPDSYSGEIPKAFVVLCEKAAQGIKENQREEETIKESICKHVADVKVNYKWLTGGVEFIDAIPKNPSGKLLRRVLRDRASKQAKVAQFRVRL